MCRKIEIVIFYVSFSDCDIWILPVEPASTRNKM